MKKLLLTFTAFALLSAAWMSPALAGFSDVDANPQYTWAKPSIDEMNRKGILTGFPDGSFQPGQPVTKAQFTVMVYRLFPLLRNPKPETIPGVPENHWAFKEFAELYSTIYPEYAADVQSDDYTYSYQPEKQMSRWDVLIVLDALFSGMDGPESVTAADIAKELGRIKDIPQRQFASYDEYETSNPRYSSLVPELLLVNDPAYGLGWAGDFDYVKAEALYRFTRLGIMTADEAGLFRPQAPVTRAEMVTILNRMAKAAGEDYAYVEPEEYISGSYLTPGSSTGFGTNLYYSLPEETIVLSESPSWAHNPGTRLTKTALRIESRQILDVYVTINGHTVKYSHEQLVNGSGKVILDVSGADSFHVRGEARHPEQLTEDGDNEVMIYVSDPEYHEPEE
ncbi:S-layer homology domain-containing protein [Paenibacillus mesotrionivorans]|uniref:S-layer homology domain-containing protein n=1 Tax=Paenibacillus mesotrionivorans TaxID=3160968 RepID=A0ACC7P003_9BACL